MALRPARAALLLLPGAAGALWAAALGVVRPDAHVAAELRAQGAENAERIRSGADRERTVILAEAYRDAEIIRGEGDAKATAIYAGAYNRDPEFYAFYRSLEAYKVSLGSEGDMLVLGPDSDFLRYLGSPKGQR